MQAIGLAEALHQANALKYATIPDPGASGIFDYKGRSHVTCALKSAGAETRTLPDPASDGDRLLLYMHTDGGDITITASSPYDETGGTSLVFSAVGQFVDLAAVHDAATTLAWRVGAYDGVTGPTTALSNITASTIAVSSNLFLLDDVECTFGTGLDAQIVWSTADASNHSFVIALGDSNQGLHITDQGAIATDWNISATTDPNLYIHSNTTPATDYLRIGDHDGTQADIDVLGGTSLALKILGTEVASVRATGLAVGTYVQASTAGTDQLTIRSTGTVPSGTGANVGHLFADFETDDDELFWLSGTVGTATQLTT